MLGRILGLFRKPVLFLLRMSGPVRPRVAGEVCVCVGRRAGSREVGFTGSTAEVEVGHSDGRSKSWTGCPLRRDEVHAVPSVEGS